MKKTILHNFLAFGIRKSKYKVHIHTSYDRAIVLLEDIGQSLNITDIAEQLTCEVWEKYLPEYPLERIIWIEKDLDNNYSLIIIKNDIIINFFTWKRFLETKFKYCSEDKLKKMIQSLENSIKNKEDKCCNQLQL